MENSKYHVILPIEARTLPSKRELSAATIVAEYFRADVYVKPCSNRKTADFIINDIEWELKTPTGSGKYNIQHALRAALTQSNNIILDVRYSKKHINKVLSEIRYQIKRDRGIKGLVVIDKSGKVIDLMKE